MCFVELELPDSPCAMTTVGPDAVYEACASRCMYACPNSKETRRGRRCAYYAARRYC